MKLLNVGCGRRIHKEWINLDKNPTHPSVAQCDVKHGLPFSDYHFDFVYHSHLLEHLDLYEAKRFLKECRRVLNPAGIIRVVVPDLEQIVINYLKALQRIRDGIISARDDYDWIMLELYDQVVRNSSGGQMAVYLNRLSIPNREYIVERCGVEVEQLMRKHEQKKIAQQSNKTVKKSSKLSLYSLQLKNIFYILREQFIKLLLGSEYEALRVGRFRCSGENHQWMYDKYSLGRMLEECGFDNIIQRSATMSYLKDWSAFNLDTESDGSVYKADSLYMEAVKS